uniref:DRBM domain-containing protein n=1 Tax=Panagrolaimus sp. PS1159 TaxID=55785 RepID=A0AC35GFU0_9BILA
MTVSENPVGTLQNICKQRGLSDPFKKVAKANVAKDMLLSMPHHALPILSQPKISEDGFQPVLSNERMKASAKASKEEVLRLIEQAVNSASEDSCCKAVDDLVKRGLLDQIFKKPVLIEKRDHKSLDPSKMLRTLHIVDANVFEKAKKLCKQNVLFSFIGIGENDKSAKNEAARNLLFHVKNYYELRVID